MLTTLPERAFRIVLERVEGLARWLDEVAARRGIRMNALVGAARAALGGHNAVWGAIVGGFRAMSPAVKVALIAALVLAVLLSPVTVVLPLLFLIVAAIVAAARASAAERPRTAPSSTCARSRAFCRICGRTAHGYQRLPTTHAPNGLTSRRLFRTARAHLCA